MPSEITSSSDPAYCGEQLRRAEALAKADPTNSLPIYRKACALQSLGRADEAYAALKAANRLGPIRFYVPDIPSEVADAMGAPPSGGWDFGDFTEIRNAARSFVDEAKGRLEHGDIRGAREMLEECCRMGINTSCAEPHAIMNPLVGIAIQSTAARQLMPLYKDHGMTDRVQRMRRLDAAYAHAQESCRSYIGSTPWWRSVSIPYVAPVMIIHLAVAGTGSFLLMVLCRIPSVVAAKRQRQEAVPTVPWPEGFIARILLALYLPLLALSIAVIYRWPGLMFIAGDWPRLDVPAPIAVAAAIVINLLAIGLSLRVLHHRYDEHTGERTSALWFVTRAPANAKVWTRKYLVALLGVQWLFILCLFALTTIVYKPIFGGHPWEPIRFRMLIMPQERAIAGRIAEDICRASLDAPWTRNNK